MANAVYPKALKAFLDADIDLLADDIRLMLVDGGTYTYSATHEFVSDVSGIVARGTALASKTTTSGAFDFDNPTITSVTGSTVEIVICYRHTGSDATARVISYHDQDSTPAALTLTPDGGNVIVTIPVGGLFSI